jgi:hypothetical protein
LAKYRKPTGLLKSSNGLPAAESAAAAAVPDATASKDREQRLDDDDCIPAYDSNNLENCKAFLDAKKKLRLILSNVDFQVQTDFMFIF